MRSKSGLQLLNEALEWLKETLKPGTTIQHKTLGEGTIQQITETTLVVYFGSKDQMTFVTRTCVDNGIIRIDSEEMQAELLKRQDVIRRDNQVRNAVRWAEQKLASYAEYVD